MFVPPKLIQLQLHTHFTGEKAEVSVLTLLEPHVWMRIWQPSPRDTLMALSSPAGMPFR